MVNLVIRQICMPLGDGLRKNGAGQSDSVSGDNADD